MYHTIIIDTNSVFNRLYFSQKNMENTGQSEPLIQNRRIETGESVRFNASTIKRYIESFLVGIQMKNPQATFVHVFDPMERDNLFRKKLDENYKSHRVEKEHDLYHQLAVLPRILDSMGQVVYASDNLNQLTKILTNTEIDRDGYYEADDLIGQIVTNPNNFYTNKPMLIMSGDKDLAQLMYDHHKVHFYHLGKDKKIYTNPEEIKADFGVYPKQIPDLLAIKGDSADGIKGIKGIGEKGALELLAHYGSVPEFLEKLEHHQVPEQKWQFDSTTVEQLMKDYLLTNTSNKAVFDFTLPDLIAYQRQKVTDKDLNLVGTILYGRLFKESEVCRETVLKKLSILSRLNKKETQNANNDMNTYPVENTNSQANSQNNHDVPLECYMTPEEIREYRQAIALKPKLK